MEEFDLQRFLEKYKNSSVDFFRFPGNYGDSLIWHGTVKLLTRLNISANYVDISSIKYHENLFIDGGGNFVDYYSDVMNFLVRKPNFYNEIIILPHTIFGDKQVEILNDLSSDLTVFCREKISAEFLKKKLKKGKVYLWHDCAFYNSFKNIKVKGEGVLNAFRSDIESGLHRQPSLNMDISSDGYAQKPLGDFINMINRYHFVNTDRLHIAIVATLLYKQVKLYPGSYYKNKAVFEYSLKKFPNINFIA